MAVITHPAGPPDELVERPNVATANLQLPGVRDYEQVDNEISASLRPPAGAGP